MKTAIAILLLSASLVAQTSVTLSPDTSMLRLSEIGYLMVTLTHEPGLPELDKLAQTHNMLLFYKEPSGDMKPIADILVARAAVRDFFAACEPPPQVTVTTLGYIYESETARQISELKARVAAMEKCETARWSLKKAAGIEAFNGLTYVK